MSDDDTTGDADTTADAEPDDDTIEGAAESGGEVDAPERRLTGRSIAAIAVGVVLVAGFVVGLVVSLHQKDHDNKSGGGGSATAATVDGVTVSKAKLDAEVAEWTSNKAYVAAALQQGQRMVQTNGQVDPTFRRDILTQEIDDVLFTREFNRRHLKITSADTAQFQQEVQQDAALQKYPKAFIDNIIQRAARVNVLQAKLTTAPTEAQIKQYYDANVACASGKDVSHILLKTLADANAIETQLAGGAQFATLAQSKSTDTGSAPNGGALGCLKKGEFVKPFEDAAFAATPNKPTAPVKSQYGYHIILITPVPTLAQAHDQIAEQIEQSGNQFNAYVDKLFGAAKVTVDPTLGAWKKGTQGYSVAAPPSATTKGSTATGNAPLPVASGRPHKP
jgi:parvulin-like peptidyl-prolyl isomerase